jgi:hypothetical protein
MYANTTPQLEPYLQDALIRSIVFDAKKQCYAYNYKGVQVTCGGLVKKLRRTYYPQYKRKRRKYNKKNPAKKRASSIAQGKRTDYELFEYVRTETKPTDTLAKGLVQYWEQTKGHCIVAAQVPVWIDDFQCITQADVMTQDKQGRLWLWEVKTGWNGVRKQGNLHTLQSVPNNDRSHWQLQLHFTQKGLLQRGVPIYQARVINAYTEWMSKAQPHVVRINEIRPPKWVSSQLQTKHAVGTKRDRSL